MCRYSTLEWANDEQFYLLPEGYSKEKMQLAETISITEESQRHD